jgi:beta-glucosidase
VEGESARFGLVRVNYDTQERTVKTSGKFYTGMIEENGVSEELYHQYVEPQKYHD